VKATINEALGRELGAINVMPPTENRKRSMRQQPRHKKNAGTKRTRLARKIL